MTDASAVRSGFVRPLVAALLLGLVAGVLTLAGQGVLPVAANRLANSGAIWLVVAFAAGAIAAPGATGRGAEVRGAVAGLVATLATLASYELAARVAATGISTGALLVWAATAVVGGPVFGAAGAWWRTGVAPRPAVAAALLGAVFLAEGLWTVARIPDLAPTGWVEAAAGLVVAVALARPRDRRGLAVALGALVPLTLLGIAAYALIERALGAG